MDYLRIAKKNKVVLFVNDIVGLEVVKKIKEQDEIGFLFIHEEKLRKCGEQIIQAAGVSQSQIFVGKDILKEEVLELLREYKPDIFITCYWAHLLRPEAFNIPKFGCLNFHPALLPYNRGWYPSVYPFLDGSPFGVTLHLIDEGADTGPIIAQREIIPKVHENSGHLYLNAQKEITSLFFETWEKLKLEGIKPIEQDHSRFTYHSKKEISSYDEINLDEVGTFKKLINKIKARMFVEKSFAFIKVGNKKYRVKLLIEEMD